MRYKWTRLNSQYIEIECLIDNIVVGEVRIAILKDRHIAKVIWIHVFKEYQGKGYAIGLLKELKDNINNYVEDINIIKFYHVTSIGVIRLINKVFKDAIDLDFSHLCYSDIDRENEVKQDFINNPWIPEKSPARYNNGSCTISKGAPGVSLIALLNKE